MKQKICVEIAGVKLSLLSENGEEYAKTVDEAVRDVMKSQKNCSLVEAALFCAMNFCSQGSDDSMKVRNLETQVALYQANLNRMRRENEELRARLNEE